MSSKTLEYQHEPLPIVFRPLPGGEVDAALSSIVASLTWGIRAAFGPHPYPTPPSFFKQGLHGVGREARDSKKELRAIFAAEEGSTK